MRILIVDDNKISLESLEHALTQAGHELFRHTYSEESLTHDIRRNNIVAENGKQFDPAIVDAFVENEEEFVAVRESLADAEIAFA